MEWSSSEMDWMPALEDISESEAESDCEVLVPGSQARVTADSDTVDTAAGMEMDENDKGCCIDLSKKDVIPLERTGLSPKQRGLDGIEGESSGALVPAPPSIEISGSPNPSAHNHTPMPDLVPIHASKIQPTSSGANSMSESSATTEGSVLHGVGKAILRCSSDWLHSEAATNEHLVVLKGDEIGYHAT
ncbi:hypothetical protein FB45DRAFT_1035955 [Roridomyces roridus]|uniref:Uncharacterized protein n=1 Tax=Roridomyces roridus TaxID=1738132 RepID=A0AAD7B9T6_9AGAR|nr:hypothetical protein FB45DRAFT_1035955 [Roridomyces roridus]